MVRKPLSILLIIEHFQLGGGSENSALALCCGLVKRGYDVHVVAMTGHSVPGVTLHLGLQDIESLTARVRPDLTVDWSFLHPCDLHRMGGGTHQSFQFYNLESYSPRKRWLKRLMLKLPRHRSVMNRQAAMLTRPGAHFVANSHFSASQAIETGADPSRVHVIHNGIDVSRFSPSICAERRSAARARFGLAPEDQVFLFVAHNLRLKNLDLLRRVFASIARRLPRVRLMIAGKRRPRWKAPWLAYAGQVDDMADAYAASDVLLHPTYFDSFANAILEAMSCGLPVVISDRSGVCEIVEHDRDGLILNVAGQSSTVDREWETAIDRLAVSVDDRHRLGNAARRRTEVMTMERQLDEWEELLHRIYAEKNGALNSPTPIS